MSVVSRSRGATHGLVVILSLAIVAATAAAKAGANSKIKPGARAEQPLVIALAESAPSVPSAAPPAMATAPVISPTPAPARFFTINEVLARRNNRALSSSSIQLASIDPGRRATEAGSLPAPGQDRSDDPFGLLTFVAPEGQLWTKWRKLEIEIEAEKPALARCRADAKNCSPAAARFSAIIDDAGKLKGRARIDAVNRRVNAAIRYRSDWVQWGVADRWSAPLDNNGKGSFDTGLGDCEDYAIAKYVALREAGVATGDLRLLLVHDKSARLDHAVLAARHDGRWLMLDNRHNVLLENKDAWFFTPLFALDAQGVKLFAAPYAAQPSAHLAAAGPANGAAQAALAPGEASGADEFAAREDTLALHDSLLDTFDTAMLRGSL
jgi:predicted transglutaminase-like cysteine proteinase